MRTLGAAARPRSRDRSSTRACPLHTHTPPTHACKQGMQVDVWPSSLSSCAEVCALSNGLAGSPGHSISLPCTACRAASWACCRLHTAPEAWQSSTVPKAAGELGGSGGLAQLDSSNAAASTRRALRAFARVFAHDEAVRLKQRSDPNRGDRCPLPLRIERGQRFVVGVDLRHPACVVGTGGVERGSLPRGAERESVF